MATLNFFDILAIRPNFFDDAEIDERLNKEDIKMAILERCGTLLPLYSNSTMFKEFSDSFFRQRKLTISKLIDTTEIKYDPIANYDRTEEMTRNYTESKENQSGTATTTETSGTENNNGTSGKETRVSAYDAESYQPKDKEDTIFVENTSSARTAKSGTKTNDKGTNTIEEKMQNRTKGNIGVTTTQQMIEAERRVRQFTVYKWIAIEFEQNFFICVS